MRANLVRSAAVVFSLCAAVVAEAQTVDEIVAMNLKAKGGADKWSSVKTVKMTGTITSQGKPLPMTVYAKRPNSTRQEVTVGGLKMVQAFDGTVAWAMDPRMGVPQQAPPAIAQRARGGADFDGALINYKEKGTTIDLVGKEKLEGREVYHLKITLSTKDVQHYYVDAESGLEVKTSAEVEDPLLGQKQTIESVMSDYRSVDGIMLPHTVRQFLNGKPVTQTTIEKVELNAPVDETLFTMPKK
jgi:hypothetical protein